MKSCEYFFKRLKNPDYAQLFHLTLRSEEAEPLRVFLRNNPEMIEASTFKLDAQSTSGAPGDKERMELHQQGVTIVYLLAKNNHKWLTEVSSQFLFFHSPIYSFLF